MCLPVQNFCRDLAEITEISARLPRSRRDSRDLAKIFPRSRRPKARRESRRDLAEIGQRSRDLGGQKLAGNLAEILAEIGQISVKILYGYACFIVRSNKRFFVSLPVFVIQLGDLEMVGTANIVT